MPASSCVCIVSALYLPAVGGVETYTAHLARALVKQGYRVIVVTSNTHALASHSSEDGIEIVRLPCHGLLNNRYPIPAKNETYRTLWAWLQEQSITYVVVNTRFYPLSLEGLALAREKGVTPVLIEHGSAHLTMGNPVVDAGVQAVEHAITKAERRYDASYYAVSRKASAWLSHFGITSQGELPNSIDADVYTASASSRSYRDEFYLSADTFVVAFVGRFVKEKGIVELAQSIQTWNSTDRIAVLAAGDGPLADKLNGYESEQFRLLGRLESADVAALLMQADVLCLPSRSEGFATSLLEAAACSTAAITTDVGGADELIPSGAYGTIIPDRSQKTIQQALKDALQSRDRVAEQGHNAGKLVRSLYSWDQTARQVIAACQKAQG